MWQRPLVPRRRTSASGAARARQVRPGQKCRSAGRRSCLSGAGPENRWLPSVSGSEPSIYRAELQNAGGDHAQYRESGGRRTGRFRAAVLVRPNGRVAFASGWPPAALLSEAFFPFGSATGRGDHAHLLDVRAGNRSRGTQRRGPVINCSDVLRRPRLAPWLQRGRVRREGLRCFRWRTGRPACQSRVEPTPL